MFLNQALVSKCSNDKIQFLMMVLQVFEDKMECNSLGFSLVLLKFCWTKNCRNLLGCGSLDVASYIKLPCPGVLVGRCDDSSFIAQKTEMQKLKNLPTKALCSAVQ